MQIFETMEVKELIHWALQYLETTCYDVTSGSPSLHIEKG